MCSSDLERTQALAEEINNAFDSIPREITVTIRAVYEGFDNPPQSTSTTISGESFAGGTKGVTGQWFKNFGQGTPAMLHGNEAVVRRDQADQFASDFGTGNVGIVDELMNIRVSLSEMPQSIARAVRDAVLVS